MTKKEKARQYLADIEKLSKTMTEEKERKHYYFILNSLKGLYYILFNEFYIEQF